MEISFVIEKTVSAIHSQEARKKYVAEKLTHIKNNKLGFECEGIPENFISFQVEKWVPEGSIAGVDSGFISKKLASIDLVLLRAIGVVFNFKNGVVSSTNYYPDYFHFPEPYLAGDSLEFDEVEQSTSLLRLREEIRTAKSIIKTYKPNYLFIDGSIVPQYQDKPRKESALSGRYSDIISEFETFYACAEENNCTIIATVEDSRGSRFRQILQEELLPKSKLAKPEELNGLFDSAILDYLLSVGERSCAFTYTKNIAQHPVLQDFNSKWAKAIYGMYLKPSLYDRPLRVEFICHGGLKEKADEIASVAMALSSLHREYAYPSVLIDADMHAKLNPVEIDIVVNRIMDKLGNSVKLKMRRDNRPF
jgi:hypothetical protein